MPKWVHNFVFITPIIGKKQIKDMDYTGEQIMFIVRWFKNLVREYKYRKRIKELRKRDPFIYK